MRRPQPRPVRRGSFTIGFVSVMVIGNLLADIYRGLIARAVGHSEGCEGAFVRNPIHGDSLEQAGLAGDHRGLGPVGGPNFAVKRFDMQLDGWFGDVQIAGDFLVGFVLCQTL